MESTLHLRKPHVFNENEMVNTSSQESNGKEKKLEEKNSPIESKTAMEIAQERYRKFFTRSIWGTIMILVFGLIIYSNHILLSLFVIFLQGMVFKEMIALRYIEAKEKHLWGFRTLHWYFLFGTFFYLYGSSVLHQLSRVVALSTLEILYRYHLAISFALYVIGFIAFIVTLKSDTYKYQFSQLTWTLMTLLVVVGQSHFIIQNIFNGLIWFLLPCSLIICNDIMAYFCGFAIGHRFIKRPLTPISPNKTWEGFIGALICTLFFGFFFSSVLANYNWFVCPKELTLDQDIFYSWIECNPDPIFQYKKYFLPVTVTTALEYFGLHYYYVQLKPIQLHGLVFALFASLIAPFGGFFASGIKRAYKVKDFDSLFPGHGGVTDRLDCQFIMGFFAYVYHITFINFSFLDAQQIKVNIDQMSEADKIDILQHLNSTLGHLVSCVFHGSRDVH